ncbi:hypothetical protein [Sphingomonas xinjiangensis]|uniref:Uncharacterized protein n=1 Tax=Sphingomonas xinjiangensis TaxID=643568 RepID=A0A840YR51_9SPHN|nr:hypothetical protein [Sphingomonas xinjiangensis]MBB5711921.1 hypothetical protein [Sphingomonas xinjiangensis]
MTNNSKQILDSVAEHAARVKARLAETHAAIARARADAAEGDAGAADGSDDADGAGRSNVIALVRC